MLRQRAIALRCEGKSRREIKEILGPGLIRFFLRFLAAAGVQQSDLAFCVHIHESADVQAAQRFWQEVTGASSGQFRKPALKRHNPKTNRKNVGYDYHGWQPGRFGQVSNLVS